MDVTQIVNLGGCQIQASTNNFSTFVDLGDQDEAGAKLSVKTSVLMAKVARFGDTPVAGWINGQVAEIEVTLEQTAWVILQQVIPGATVNTNGSGSNLTIGVLGGTKLTPFSLKLKSLLSGFSPLYDVTAVNVITVGAWEMPRTGKKEQQWKVKFAVLVNQNAVNGANVLTIGDTTITQGAAATAAITTPTLGATGVATSATVTWTFSATLNASSVTTTGPQPTVGLLESAGSSTSDSGNLVPGSAVLTNNGASTIIVFTPTSALTASDTVYIPFIQGLVDSFGNLLPMYTSQFTTT